VPKHAPPTPRSCGRYISEAGRVATAHCIVPSMTVGSSLPAPKRKRALSPAFTANIWRPGQSGNPVGHSGLYGEAVSLARQAAPAAVRRLIELMASEDERVASVAANAILDRAFGRPREFDPASEDARPKSTFDPRRYSAEQLAQIEKALRIVVEVQGPGAHPQTTAGHRAGARTLPAARPATASNLTSYRSTDGHPIVLDEWPSDPEDPEKRSDGIIDGRNRLAACEMAKVEPRFERFDGKDIAAFIVATNINRRQLTKGQQAMALAFAHTEGQRGRGNRDEAVKSAESADFSRTWLRQARQLLRHSREMAMAVLAGGLKFEKALETIEEREQADTKPEARIAALRERYLILLRWSQRSS
jgi:hypothetical protein